MNSYQKLQNSLKGKVKFNEPLRKHTTFGIGGPVKIWVEPHDTEDLKKALKFAKEKRLKVFALGLGSNILAPSSGFNGMIVHLVAPEFKKIEFKDTNVIASSGANLNHLVILSAKHSLGGLEDLIGIPGTLGGALRMNSSYKRSIGELVTRIKVIDKDGNIRILTKKDLKFGYRKSNLSKYIIIYAELKLKKERKFILIKKCHKFMKERKNKQPWHQRSAGSVFKNPRMKDFTAGILIEQSGLKGKRIGDAVISRKHANFIINKRQATSNDVKTLMDLVKKEVYKKFKVKLKPEIIIL